MKPFRFHPTLPERQTNVMTSAVPRLTLASLMVIGCAWVTTSSALGEDRVQYNRDVRPILFDNCLSCHGPDSAARQADLRLDKRDAAIDRSAIVAGDPDSSEMIRRILSTDADE